VWTKVTYPGATVGSACTYKVVDASNYTVAPKQSNTTCFYK
jgi:hypothetical protein